MCLWPLPGKPTSYLNGTCEKRTGRWPARRVPARSTRRPSCAPPGPLPLPAASPLGQRLAPHTDLGDPTCLRPNLTPAGRVSGCPRRAGAAVTWAGRETTVTRRSARQNSRPGRFSTRTPRHTDFRRHSDRGSLVQWRRLLFPLVESPWKSDGQLPDLLGLRARLPGRQEPFLAPSASLSAGTAFKGRCPICKSTCRWVTF